MCANVSKMALPRIPLLNLRGPPCLDLNPGTHDLRYKLPIRDLNGKELMKIHDELDFVERFTERYSFLFRHKLVENHPLLLDLCNHVIIALETMQHHGKHSGRFCNAMQLHLLTTANTADYIASVEEYCVSCWMVLTPHEPFEQKFRFFNEDVNTLGIMKRSLHKLLHEICPSSYA